MARKESLNTRVTRLEDLHADLAAKMIVLAEAQIKTDERIEKLVSSIDERVAMLVGIIDGRIGKLVSAIGELIARMPDGSRRDEHEG
jgi:hypothetical protein